MLPLWGVAFCATTKTPPNRLLPSSSVCRIHGYPRFSHVCKIMVWSFATQVVFVSTVSHLTLSLEFFVTGSAFFTARSKCKLGTCTRCAAPSWTHFCSGGCLGSPHKLSLPQHVCDALLSVVVQPGSCGCHGRSAFVVRVGKTCFQEIEQCRRSMWASRSFSSSTLEVCPSD